MSRLQARSTRTKSSEASVPLRSSTTLQFPRALNAMPRIRERLQSRLGDQVAALHATSELSVVEPFECLDDLLQRPLLIFDQAECEFLIVVFSSDVRHVERNVG